MHLFLSSIWTKGCLYGVSKAERPYELVGINIRFTSFANGRKDDGRGLPSKYGP